MLNYISSLLIFTALFAGDFSLSGVSISLIASVIFLALRIQCTEQILIKLHWWYFLTFGLLTVELINGIVFSQTEAIMKVQIFSSGLIFFIAFRNTLQREGIWRGMKLIAVFFLAGSLLDIGSPNERGFIFGPNILYRIVLLPYFNAGFLIVLAITVGISIATLSRGAFLTGFVLAFWQVNWRWKALLAPVFVIGGIILLRESGVDLPRFAKFYDASNSNSISDRFLVLNSTSENLSILGNSYASFGKNFSFITYPHNSVIELIFFYGVFGAITATYLLALLGLAILGKRKSVVIICILPTLFSGNLIDNFMILTLAAVYDA